MRRIAIVGNAGTGKTTLARQLAAKLDLTHIELDALFHEANWTPTPPHRFQAKIHAATARADATTNGWTTCGNYRSASDRVAQKAADTIIWLDMPRWLVMSRITRRTLRRVITRQELWNGNREALTDWLRWDPNKNLLRWAWTKNDSYRQQGLTAMVDGTWAHATVHRLCSPSEVAGFVAAAIPAG